MPSPKRTRIRYDPPLVRLLPNHLPIFMAFSALSQSLSFHKSPESFISSRLSDLAVNDPSQLPTLNGGTTSGIIRASILNRNVHIISSYQLCSDILGSSSPGPLPQSIGYAGNRHDDDLPEPSEPVFAASPAYKDLMAPFFPPPNLLLADGEAHRAYKESWRAQVETMPESLVPVLKPIIASFIDSAFQPGATVDIYEAMKTLAWELLFSAFLPTEDSSTASLEAEVEALQETLLRGQFSTFPVPIRTPFFASARSKGISARQKLQALLKKPFESAVQQQSVNDNSHRCPFLQDTSITSAADLSNHTLLFTSSLANKALASLLTSSVMNVFLYNPSASKSDTLADLLRSHLPSSPSRINTLHSILRETERLSPPVVGVLRRATTDLILRILPNDPETRETKLDHPLPKGHEAWLYFPSASRDKSIFGDDANLFQWDRFVDTPVSQSPSTQSSFAFGGGGKACLGREISQTMVRLVVDGLLHAGVDMEAVEGKGPEEGVRAMLGWERAKGVEVFARDLKQLPCQRARRGVKVKIGRCE